MAVMLHEIAHAVAALRLGDPSAKSLGRITLNPIRHIDPFLTILVPAALLISNSPIVFGGAKPVPVNPLHFKDPRRGMLWVAAAGPGANFILAGLSYVAFIIWQSWFSEAIDLSLWLRILGAWCYYGIFINLVLGIFNLIPIPPLDGGRIAVGLLPVHWARRLAAVERYGLVIVIAVVYLMGRMGWI